MCKLVEAFGLAVVEMYTKMGKEKLLVKHVAYPDEVAEAYIFLMKCVFPIIIVLERSSPDVFGTGASTSQVSVSMSMAVQSSCEVYHLCLSTVISLNMKGNSVHSYISTRDITNLVYSYSATEAQNSHKIRVIALLHFQLLLSIITPHALKLVRMAAAIAWILK